MVVTLIVVMGCPSWEPAKPIVDELLASPDSEERMRGFVSLDRDEMVERLDLLIEMAESDPDPYLRTEVVRQLGYTRDPRVLPVLDAIAADPDVTWDVESGGYLRYAVIESYAYYSGDEGCSRFAARVHDMPRDEHGFVVDRPWYAELVARAEHCQWAMEPYRDADPQIEATLLARAPCCRAG